LSSEKGLIGCNGNKGRCTAVYKDGTGRRAARAPFDSGVLSPFLPGRIDPGESKDEQATKQGRGGNLAGKTKDELLLIWLVFWIHLRVRRHPEESLPKYGLPLEAIALLLMGLTGHLDGFLSGVNGPG
jgi:hypothetical protein